MSMTVHVVLGFRDSDIVYWRSSLPKNCFTHYIREIVNSERNKEIAILPVPEERGILMRKEEVQIIFRTNAEMRFIRSLPKGKRAAMLKSIIRKHLLANYRKTGVEEEEIPPQQEQKVIPAEQKDFPDRKKEEIQEEKTPDKIEIADEEDEMSEEYKRFLREMAGY